MALLLLEKANGTVPSVSARGSIEALTTKPASASRLEPIVR
jgi:hypothetical protein